MGRSCRSPRWCARVGNVRNAEQLEELLIRTDMVWIPRLRVTRTIGEGRVRKAAFCRLKSNNACCDRGRTDHDPIAKPLPIYAKTPQVVAKGWA